MERSTYALTTRYYIEKKIKVTKKRERTVTFSNKLPQISEWAASTVC